MTQPFMNTAVGIGVVLNGRSYRRDVTLDFTKWSLNCHKYLITACDLAY